MPMTIPSTITPEEKAKWREEALACGPVLHLLNALESTEYELEKLKTRYHHLWCEEANTTLEMCGLKEKLDAAEKEVRRLETELQSLIDMQTEKIERQRDFLLKELLQLVGTVNGNWLPHPDDMVPGKKSYTKEEAKASWLKHASKGAANE